MDSTLGRYTQSKTTGVTERDMVSGAESEVLPLRIGAIGYGYWGPQLVRNLSRLPMAQVCYVADLSPARRASAMLDHPTVSVISDAEDVLRSDVDAVVIATPIRTHFRLAQAALERNKHVFVEKPLASSVHEARTLIDVARQRGRVLMTGHTFMYNPAVEELRQLVQSGALGEIYYVDATRANLGLVQPDVNVVWDLAPHDLSILSYVFGMCPVRVSANGAAYVQAGIEDVAHLTLEYSTGMLAHVQLSWLSPAKIRTFTVVGSRQMAIYNDVDPTEKIRIFNRGIDKPAHTSTFGEFQLSYRYGAIVSPHIPWAEPLAVECKHFADAIRENKIPRSDGVDGLRVVRILEAANASLANHGAFVEVDPKYD